MSLREEIGAALGRRHGYSRHTDTVYRVKRLGETIYTTAHWAALEGRPRVVEIFATGELGAAKSNVVALVQSTKAERLVIAKFQGELSNV